MGPNHHRRVHNAQAVLWPLDFALVLLGVLVIGLITRLLRFDDPRIAYNAWTYWIGVPSVLIAMSMLTRTLVSEQVERSLQIGFLLSVALHLALMVVAVNVVLFSGMWPDALENVERMVRIESRASQFFEMQAKDKAFRPDFLRPVETELTQPTRAEVKPSESKDAALDRLLTQHEAEVRPEAAEMAKKVDSVDPLPEPEAIATNLQAPDRPQRDKPTTTLIPVPKTEARALPQSEPNAIASLAKSSDRMSVPRSDATSQDISPRSASLDTNTLFDATVSKERVPLDAAKSRPLSQNATLPDLSRLDAPRIANLPRGSVGASKPGTRRQIEVPKNAQGQDDGNANDNQSVANASEGSGTGAELLDRTAGSTRMDGRVSSSVAASASSASTASFSPEGTGTAAQPIPSVGGAAPSPGLQKAAGAAIAEVTVPDAGPSQLDVGRFRRRALGGVMPRAQVPVPVPAFSQRMRRNEQAMNEDLKAMGPLGPQTEDAIERGLEFLARYQREDGSWHLDDFGDQPRLKSDTAATALALLSFQGAGYSHVQYKYQDVCRKALAWLRANQSTNGDLYKPMDEASDRNAWLYSHGIATLALCEAYGMTQDEAIRDSAQRAVDFLVSSQDPVAGGWRYAPRVGSDTSVTGWAMMALKSAELSGLTVPRSTYEGIAKWLNGSEASARERYLYRYNWQANTPETMHGRIPTPVMTSVGLLMRFYLGWRRTTGDMVRGSDWLLERLPSVGTAEAPQRDTYYWYYASQVMFHMGGERWKRWYGVLYPLLLDSQELSGDFAGSWDPAGPVPDAWGPYAGRLYVTTLNLLSLEVTYRHLPLYEATAQ